MPTGRPSVVALVVVLSLVASLAFVLVAQAADTPPLSLEYSIAKGAYDNAIRDILHDPLGQQAIDIVAIDHYPGTWCCGSNYRDWGALDSLANLAQEFGKEIGVMETGLSTEDPLDIFGGHTYWDQEVFVNEALNEVLIKRNAYNAQRPLNVLILVSWYELIDRCSTCLLSGEDNWGILFGDQFVLGPKPAYEELQYQVSRWN